MKYSKLFHINSSMEEQNLVQVQQRKVRIYLRGTRSHLQLAYALDASRRFVWVVDDDRPIDRSIVSRRSSQYVVKRIPPRPFPIASSFWLRAASLRFLLHFHAIVRLVHLSDRSLLRESPSSLKPMFFFLELDDHCQTWKSQ